MRSGTLIGETVLVAVLALSLTAASAPARAGVDVNVLFGWCGLSDDAWEDLQDGLSAGAGLGLQVSHAREGWPVHAVASLSTCEVDETEAGLSSEVSLSDYAAGVLWFPRKSPKRPWPYLGGGVAFVDGDLEILTSQPLPGTQLADSDTATALYVQGGVLTRIGGGFTFGLDLRLVRGSELTLFGTQFEPGTFQARLSAGYRW